MKKFFGILAILMFFSSNCFAMIFSKPEKIGYIWLDNAGFYGNGYVIEGATNNVGKKRYSSMNNGKFSYLEGTACFGSSGTSVYVNYGKGILRLGDKNFVRSVTVPIYADNRIFRIETDNKITLYPITAGHEGYGTYFILGRRADGVFVKYIDMENVTQKYFGLNKHNLNTVFYDGLSCQKDTLILKYHLNGNKRGGEFRFKWDDKAQWFGIEQVVY